MNTHKRVLHFWGQNEEQEVEWFIPVDDRGKFVIGRGLNPLQIGETETYEFCVFVAGENTVFYFEGTMETKEVLQKFFLGSYPLAHSCSIRVTSWRHLHEEEQQRDEYAYRQESQDDWDSCH